jgi:leucyl/phenylalanyl-tRNA---protein transferase
VTPAGSPVRAGGAGGLESAAMLIWSSLDLRPDDPVHMLWRYANGAFPCFVSDDVHGPVGWIKCSHRGVLWLDKLHAGDKQRRQILDKRFEFRCNAAFEQVVRFCADPGRDGFTWLTEDLIGGMLRLREMGFAHSFEAWEAGELAGGAFGIQFGAVMMIQSIFHRADNAGKAAFVRGMLHLRERGFELIDLNLLPEHAVRWGDRKSVV